MKRLRFVGILAADSRPGDIRTEESTAMREDLILHSAREEYGHFQMCVFRAPAVSSGRLAARPEISSVAVSPLSSIGMRQPFAPGRFSRIGRE